MARYQYNLKLVVEVETDRDPLEVHGRLDALFDSAKPRVSLLVHNVNPPLRLEDTPEGQ